MRSLNSRESGSPLARNRGYSRVNAAIALVVLAATLTIACGGGTPQTPSSPTAPTTTSPLAPSSTNWMVTHRFLSVTGPENCWIQQQRESLTGVVFSNLEMTAERSVNGSIKISSQWFVEYVGTMDGREFTAQQAEPLTGSGGRACPDGTNVQQLPGGVSNLSGSFSVDDQLLTATERNSYHLATGELVVYAWEWRATRR
jgi:hypothetical protein